MAAHGKIIPQYRKPIRNRQVIFKTTDGEVFTGIFTHNVFHYLTPNGIHGIGPMYVQKWVYAADAFAFQDVRGKAVKVEMNVGTLIEKG